MMSRLKTLWMLPVIALALAACSDSNNNGGTGPTPVAAPTNLTVTQTSLTSLQVSWTAASGATGYLLQRASATNPGVFTQIGAGILSSTSYDDAGLTPTLAYSYRVASVTASDTSAFTSAVTAATGVSAATLSGQHHDEPDPLRRHALHPERLREGAERRHPYHPGRHQDRGRHRRPRQLALDSPWRQDRCPGHRRGADRLHLGPRPRAPGAGRLGRHHHHRQRHHQPDRRARS